MEAQGTSDRCVSTRTGQRGCGRALWPSAITVASCMWRDLVSRGLAAAEGDGPGTGHWLPAAATFRTDVSSAPRWPGHPGLPRCEATVATVATTNSVTATTHRPAGLGRHSASIDASACTASGNEPAAPRRKERRPGLRELRRLSALPPSPSTRRFRNTPPSLPAQGLCTFCSLRLECSPRPSPAPAQSGCPRGSLAPRWPLLPLPAGSSSSAISAPQPRPTSGRTSTVQGGTGQPPGLSVANGSLSRAAAAPGSGSERRRMDTPWREPAGLLAS